MSKDEQGNVYFNNWIWNVTASLVKGAPKSCALRLTPGASRLDPAWTLPYAGLTGGREAANFNYIGNGKALLSVFHQERVTIDPATDPGELAGTPNWRLWSVDLDAHTAAPFEDIAWNTGATSIFQLDGRVFAFVPGKDWALTQGYEIKDGKPTLAFEVRGWSYSFLKVR
jgi:hypothetical protein